MPNLVVVAQTVWALVRQYKKIGGRWAPPLEMRGEPDHLETRPFPQLFCHDVNTRHRYNVDILILI